MQQQQSAKYHQMEPSAFYVSVIIGTLLITMYAFIQAFGLLGLVMFASAVIAVIASLHKLGGLM